MKLERKIYKIIRFIKSGKEHCYTLIEDTNGLYAEEMQEDGSILRTKIGNFFLRFIKIDDNDKSEHSSKILHYFQVYYIDNGKECLAEKWFCYKNGQYVTAKIESGFPYGAYLDSTTREVLDYFKGYLKELIRNGVMKDGLCVQNEAIIQKVKEYLICFVEFIQGRENLFLETDFSYKNNIEFYNNYRICSTKDLYIVSRTIKEDYKKIGFYHLQKNCYIIDLSALRRLMLDECKENMTARNLNEGLKSLKLIGCKYCFKNTTGEYHANLTGLYVDKLMALAYPNGIPDAPNEEPELIEKEEIEPIEEILNNTNNNGYYDEDNEDDLNDNEGIFRDIIFEHKSYTVKEMKKEWKKIKKDIKELGK